MLDTNKPGSSSKQKTRQIIKIHQGQNICFVHHVETKLEAMHQHLLQTDPGAIRPAEWQESAGSPVVPALEAAYARCTAPELTE